MIIMKTSIALKSMGSRAQKSNKHRIIKNKKQGQLRVIIRKVGPPRILGGNVILKRYVFTFLRNVDRFSDDFNVYGNRKMTRVR